MGTATKLALILLLGSVTSSCSVISKPDSTPTEISRVPSSFSNFCDDQNSINENALELLKNYDAEGLRVYNQLTDKKSFTRFLGCDVETWHIDTAVHESVHTLDHSDQDPGVYRYVLLNGKQLSIPQKNLPKFKVAPGAFANDYDKSDFRVQTYIVGNSLAGATIFGILDELNAASHGVMTAVHLSNHLHAQTDSGMRITNTGYGNRAELLSFMTFLKLYSYELSVYDVASLEKLNTPPYAMIIQTLWNQAESVLNLACQVPSFGVGETDWAKRLYSDEHISQISEILKRRPQPPVACQTLQWSK